MPSNPITITVTMPTPHDPFHEQAVALSGRNGINGHTIATLARNFVTLLSTRWPQLCEVAHNEENEGRISFGIRFSLDMSGRVPRGQAVLSFTQRTEDEVQWAVEDPDQTRLPLDPPIGSIPPGRVPPRPPVRDTLPDPATVAARVAASPPPERPPIVVDDGAVISSETPDERRRRLARDRMRALRQARSQAQATTRLAEQLARAADAQG